MMKTIFLPALCLLSGLAAGWWSGGGEPTASGEAGSPRLSPRKAGERSRAASQVLPPDIAARLRQVHAAPNPAERLRAVIHLARTLPIEELPRWYDCKRLGLTDGSEDNVFYEITRSRWLAEDPAGLMDRARLENWSNLGDMAARFARSDPDAAVSYLRDVRNPKERLSLLHDMAPAIAAVRPDAFLQLAADHAGEHTGSYRWREGLRTIAETNPAMLEQAGLPFFLQDMARTVLHAVRLRRDFGAELSVLLASPSGKKDLMNAFGDHKEAEKLSMGLLNHLHRIPGHWMDALADRSGFFVRHHAESWLAVDLVAHGMSEDRARDLRLEAWHHLAAHDPVRFMQVTETLKGTSDTAHFHYLCEALRRLAETNPEQADAWLAHHLARATDEETRGRLRQAVEPKPPGEFMSPEVVLRRFKQASADPSQLAEFSGEIEYERPAARRAFESAFLSLPEEKRAAVGHLLSFTSLENRSRRFQADVVGAMASQPPDEAAGRLERTTVETASRLAASWGTEDPAAAGRWVMSLPAGEPRRWAIRNLAAIWALHDRGGAEGWIGRLPATEQAEVRDFLSAGGSDSRR